MSKFSVIVIAFLILFVLFANGFSASYTSRKLGNLAYVLALGIDVGENSKLKVSAQFTKSASVSPGSGTSAEDVNNIVLVSGEADSIFSALNLLNSYIGKEINLSHCALFIFSEELAQKGIGTEIYSLINNEDVRPTANLVVSKCTAYEYLNNSKPNLEKLTTQYYETFSITGRFTGYFSNISIGDFYNALSAKCHQPTAILGSLNSTARKENSKKSNESSGSSDSENSGEADNSSKEFLQSSTNNESDQAFENSNVITNPEDLIAGTSSIEGKRGTENFGLAVFKEDKLCGELTAMESLCHLLIQNKIDSCIVSIDNPILEKENKQMELQLFPRKNTKINVTIDGDSPHITINLNLHADIMTLEKDVEYTTDEILTKISNATKDYLTQQFKNYLEKVSKEYESDIDNFCTTGTANFLTIPDWENFNWNEKFKNSNFDININVNVLSTMLVTKT